MQKEQAIIILYRIYLTIISLLSICAVIGVIDGSIKFSKELRRKEVLKDLVVLKEAQSKLIKQEPVTALEDWRTLQWQKSEAEKPWIEILLKSFELMLVTLTIVITIIAARYWVYWIFYGKLKRAFP